MLKSKLILLLLTTVSADPPSGKHLITPLVTNKDGSNSMRLNLGRRINGTHTS